MLSDKQTLALVEQFKRVDYLKGTLSDMENGRSGNVDEVLYSDMLIQYEKELSTLNGLMSSLDEPVNLLELSQKFLKD